MCLTIDRRHQRCKIVAVIGFVVIPILDLQLLLLGLSVARSTEIVAFGTAAGIPFAIVFTCGFTVSLAVSASAALFGRRGVVH